MSRLTILNAQVLMDKDLTLTDLRVYGAICMFANTHSSICFPKQQTIADRLGINVPMVSKSVGVLVEKGYILKGAKVGADGRKKQNYYTIKYDIILQENELMPEHNSGVDELMPQDNCELMPQDKSLYNTNSFNLITPLTKKNKTKKENPTISSLENVQPVVKENLTTQKPKQEVHFPQEFIEFYEGYEGKHPSKQKQTATTVLKKWKIMRKTYTNAEILLQVKQYAEYLQNAPWRDKKGIQFVSEKFLFEGDWIEKKLIQETKQKKPTFNNQYAKTKPDYLEVQKRYAATGELQLSTTYRKRRD